MVTIRTLTWVDAPVERCFKLSTSVDFQLASAKPKNIRVIAGVQSGLLEQGDIVTWQGGMFGVGRTATVRIEVVRPFSYIYETMVAGAFTRYEHERHFAAMNDGTRIKDEVRFAVQFGPLQGLIERFVMRNRVAASLAWRNEALKETAESNAWKRFLEERPPITGTDRREPGKVPAPAVETKSHFLAH